MKKKYTFENLDEKKDKAAYLLSHYKEKEYVPNKCFFKYFWHGFKRGIIFSIEVKPFLVCPHCCRDITEEEYYEGYVFVFGCSNCREKKEKIGLS